MWSTVYLCLLATSAIAFPEWRENSEYQYEVLGRTLTGLHEVAPQYSGLLYKAVLKIQAKSEEILQAQVINARFSRVHTYLEHGIASEIPETELSWKRLDLSSKPFEIRMVKGEIKGLTVSEEIEDWEENMIKGIVSQFQLKISERRKSFEDDGSSEERSKEDVLYDFTVWEDTITGETETLYRINKLPEYMLPSVENFDQIVGQKRTSEGVYEVTKHKNYSLSANSPSYFYGLGGVRHDIPLSNKMGSFFTRGSFSRAIISGDLDKYIIQHTFTVSEIIVNPTLMAKQKGSVYSMVNVTLKKIERNPERIEKVQNPIELNSLVYSNEYLKENVDSSSSNRKTFQYRSPKSSMSRRSLSYDVDHTTSEFYESDMRVLFRSTEQEKMRFIQKVKKICKEIAEDIQNPYTMLREGTMDKFTILNSQVRQLKANDLKQIADELYDARQASERDAWKIFRDSVAVSGTEPALNAIKEWILSSRISEAEAALVVSSMAKTVRQPSVEYLQSFFELIKDHRVLSEWPLNDTAVLSYSKLVRSLYTDDTMTFNQFPLRAIKQIRSQGGLRFLKRTIIPYFTEQLDRAIEAGQTHKIHVYIQVLGNIAHPQILVAFQPYLEGEKQASQYQRLLMVLSMNKLAELHPEQVRGVFMRLYENVGENPHVRAVAVYQIIRTKPPAGILQYMASFTNVDKHEIVNAAVKSSIESLSTFTEECMSGIRQAAESAKPLLTKKTFGIQDDAEYVRHHLVEGVKIHFTETVESIGSEDQFIPRGMRYTVAYNLGGLRNELLNVQAMVSNIDEVINVFKHQTEKYSKEQRKHAQAYEEQSQNKLSSQYIAEVLNIKPEEHEQLEGSLYLEQGILQGMLSFDNTTVPRLMSRLQEWEEELKVGKQIQYINFFSERGISMSFPTEMGFLFAYNYETPTMVKINGCIRAASKPKMSGEKLRHPELIEIKSDLTVTVTSKVQGRLTVLTPFNRESYISGYDRNIQVHLPISGLFHWDLNKRQIRAELESKSSHEKHRPFHYSSWPYTSRISDDELKPVSLQPHTRIIRQPNIHSSDKVIGDRLTGIALRVQVEHERNVLDLQHLRELVSKHGVFMGVISLWDEAEIQYSQVNITHLENESTTKKVVVRLGSKHEYANKPKTMQESEFDIKQTPEERQKIALNRVMSGIKNAKGESCDVSVEFQGDAEIKYVVIGAYAKSDSDPKSKVLLKAWKKSNIRSDKPYEVSLKAENMIENTNEIDLKYSMRTEPKMSTEMKLSFGAESETPTTVEVKLQLKRSQERKRFLEKQRDFKRCQSEMSEGDYMMPICQNITLNYNLLDDIEANVKYGDIPRRLESLLRTLYYGARYNSYPNTEIDTREKSEKQNEIRIQGRFDEDLRSVNISIRTSEEKTTFKSIRVGEVAKRVFVVHPVYHVGSRLKALALGLETYRPTCVVDQNKISTFLNKIYPADLTDNWTAMLQFLPKQARQEEEASRIRDQLKQQTENYAIFVKKDSDSKKRLVKITLSTPETEFRVLDITLKPTQEESSRAEVEVNGEDVTVSENEAYQYGNGFVQIYLIPNGEMKVEIRDQFYVIFDGQRVKLSLLNGKYRDATRGICGQYNDNKMEEFLTPANCFIRDHKKFIETYEVEGSCGQETRRKLETSNSIKCFRKTGPVYVSLVKLSNERDDSRYCTKFQTRYVEKGDEICFTVRPMAACGGTCQSTSPAERKVPVHCVKKSSVTQVWKKQIDNGGSPDFSHKPETRKESMEVPQLCA